MIDKSKPIPLYYQVQEMIIKLIEDGSYSINNPLPSEKELIKQFGVSRTTIRQAVDNLVNLGYLERRRGVGTFVAKREKKHYWELETLRSFSEEFEKKGYEVSTKLLSIEKQNTPAELFTVFKEIDEVFKIERLRFLNNRPAILVTTYVPVNIASDLDKYDLSNVSLFEILRTKYNVKIAYGKKEFRAQLVSAEDAKLLEMDENQAIQLVKTESYDNNGKIVDYSISRDIGDLSVYKVTLNYQD